jgi:hypothetical protein
VFLKGLHKANARLFAVGFIDGLVLSVALICPRLAFRTIRRHGTVGILAPLLAHSIFGSLNSMVTIQR